jgi:hypothetical protein
LPEDASIGETPQRAAKEELVQVGAVADQGSAGQAGQPIA